MAALPIIEKAGNHEGMEKNKIIAETIRKCCNVIGENINLSRNFKAELKEAIIRQLEELKGVVDRVKKLEESGATNSHTIRKEDYTGQLGKELQDLFKGEREQLNRMLKEHTNAIKENTQVINAYKCALETTPVASQCGGDCAGDKTVIREIGLIKEITQNTHKMVTKVANTLPTYAEVTLGAKITESTIPKPAHSIIVATTTSTYDDTRQQIKNTLKAKETGLQIDGIRGIRNGRIVLTCATKAELEKATERLKQNTGLKIEEARQSNPLIILRNIMSYNTEDDIITAIKTK